MNVEASRFSAGQPSPDISGERLRPARLPRAGQGILATCVQALLEPVIPPARLRKGSAQVAAGQEYDLDELCARLAAAGYEFEVEVLAKGQASRRGGVLDVWPLTEDGPARLEFFGDALESIRRFDPAAQRSRDEIQELSIPPATEAAEGAEAVAPTDYFPAGASFV